MPCYVFKSTRGKKKETLFICSRKKLNFDSEKCYKCGKKAVCLCDADGESFGFHTCDKPMCQEHANRIGTDTDVCEEHFNEFSMIKANANRRIRHYWDNPRECRDCREYLSKNNFCKKHKRAVNGAEEHTCFRPKEGI